MRIGSNIPFQMAKAYGLQSAPKLHSAPAARAPGATGGVGAPLPTTTAPPASKPTEQMNQLVAGHVREAVDFDSASTPARPAGPVLQLYTRAADKVEAAIGVHVGRTLDLKG